MSTQVNKANEEQKEEKATKHAVADTLADSNAAVGVLKETIQGTTITKYITGLENHYGLVLPSNPRANRIKRFKLCKIVEKDSTEIELKALSQLSPEVQEEIANKISPLVEEDKERAERKRGKHKPDTKAPTFEEREDKWVRDKDEVNVGESIDSQMRDDDNW